LPTVYSIFSLTIKLLCGMILCVKVVGLCLEVGRYIKCMKWSNEMEK